MPDLMSVSPQVQAYSDQAQATGPDQVDQLFKERFTQMAYQVLFSKFSEMAPQVVTFKVLEIDSDTGRGIGVFIVNYNDKPVYVPVVMHDSRLKPMEMFFYKDLNVFLPLSKEWLEEIAKMSLTEMGTGAELPQGVPQDVNIRDLVVPPTTTTGRVGYASDESQMETDAKRMFKEAELQGLDVQPQFLNVLRNAPQVVLDGMKLAFEQQPTLLQKLASNYGTDPLVEAMREGYANAAAQEKTAGEAPGDIKIFTKTSSADLIKDVFGDRAGDAFSQIVKEGYAVEDTRTIEKVAMKVEGPTFLDSPGPNSGWYRLYFVDGKPGIYFVIPFPKSRDYYRWNRAGAVCCSDRPEGQRQPIEYLVISKDGKEAWLSNDIMGEKLHNLKEDGIAGSKIGKLLNTDVGGGDTPKPGSYGFFINVTGSNVEATQPIRIESAVTDGGIKKFTTVYNDGKFVIDQDPSRKKFDWTMKGDLCFVPNTAKFVQLLKVNNGADDSYRKISEYERKQKNSVIKDPKLFMRWMNNIMQKSGGQQVNVKSAGLHEWWVGGENVMLPHGYALHKVASVYGISAEDAEGILKEARELKSSKAYIMDRQAVTNLKLAFDKLAQPPMPQEQPTSQEQSMAPGGAPGGEPGGAPPAPPAQSGDPSMMDPNMDPAMAQQGMLPPAPPAMSPTDLAIGEAVQGLQQQNEMAMQQNQSEMQQLQQKMEMEMQQNESLVNVLQTIQQRAQDISGATGGMVPAEAGASPMVAAQALAPMPEEEPPPPPMPMMDTDSLSAETVASQINPEMVDQAGEFQDEGMFDTAAVAMLAAAPVLQDIVSMYVPNLEKAIDNLGRVLLTLWMKEKETKEAVGDEAFISLEDKLRTVFKNMGDVVLALSHNASSAQEGAAQAQQAMQNG